MNYLYREDGPVGTLTLDRPNDGNMFTPQMCHEVCDRIERRVRAPAVAAAEGERDDHF